MALTKYEKAAKKLVRLYNTTYKKKFAVVPSDNSEEAVSALVNILTVSAENDVELAQITESLELAIKWYVLYHNTTNSNGQTFSRSLKFLLTSKDDWLLKTCIEQGRNADFALLEKTKGTSDATKRAVKRGDLRVFDEKDNVMSVVQQCLAKIGEIEKMHTGFRREAKKMAELKDLFKTEVPSLAYANRAHGFLEKIHKAALTN